MIFVTVGTSFGFDRLIRAVDQAVEQGLIQETIRAQIGDGRYLPRHFDYVTSIGKLEFDGNIRTASAVISHAGMGTLTAALEQCKPIMVMPRLKRYGEVVNDHQVDIAEQFANNGHVLLARDERDLLRKIASLKGFVPKPRRGEASAVTNRISAFLHETQARPPHRYFVSWDRFSHG